MMKLKINQNEDIIINFYNESYRKTEGYTIRCVITEELCEMYNFSINDFIKNYGNLGWEETINIQIFDDNDKPLLVCNDLMFRDITKTHSGDRYNITITFGNQNILGV